MSEVYCRICDDDECNVDSPACLINVTGKARTNSDGCRPKHKTILTVESELEMTTTSKLSTSPQKTAAKVYVPSNKYNDDNTKSSPRQHCATVKSRKIAENKFDNIAAASGEEYEMADDATMCDDNTSETNYEVRIVRNVDQDEMIRVHGREELPVTPEEQVQCNISDYNSDNSNDSIDNICEQNPSKRKNTSHPVETEPNDEMMHSMNNLLNDTISHNIDAQYQLQCNGKLASTKVNCTDNHPLLVAQSSIDDLCGDTKQKQKQKPKLNDHDDLNGNESIKLLRQMHRIYSTLPKTKKASTMQKMIIQNERLLKSVPTRLTPDGTMIYYWCDLPKQSIKG